MALSLSALLTGPLQADDDLPTDRQRLENRREGGDPTEGFELPEPTDAPDTSDAALRADPMQGWSSDDPRITRREDRLLLVASTYGFAGAFGGFSVWALVASASQQTPKGRRDWRRVSLALASVSGAALILGTVLWATSPKPKRLAPAASLALSLQLGPAGASAGLQLRFF